MISYRVIQFLCEFLLFFFIPPSQVISSLDLSAFNNAGIDVDDNRQIYDTQSCYQVNTIMASFLLLIMKIAFILLSLRIVLHGQLLYSTFL